MPLSLCKFINGLYVAFMSFAGKISHFLGFLPPQRSRDGRGIYGEFHKVSIWGWYAEASADPLLCLCGAPHSQYRSSITCMLLTMKPLSDHLTPATQMDDAVWQRAVVHLEEMGKNIDFHYADPLTKQIYCTYRQTEIQTNRQADRYTDKQIKHRTFRVPRLCNVLRMTSQQSEVFLQHVISFGLL